MGGDPVSPENLFTEPSSNQLKFSLIPAILSILPDSMAFEVAAIDKCHAELFSEEARYIRNAVKKRQREFTAGRECARNMLARLGVAPCPIPAGPFREPVWPVLISASITHQDNYCIAAGAWQKDIPLLGIDLASSEPLGADLTEYVCTGKDLIWIERHIKDFKMDPYKLVFSIKESLYKCLFPVTRQIFDFKDLGVYLDPRSCHADVELLNRSLFSEIETRKINVSFCHNESYVFTIAWIQ